MMINIDERRKNLTEMIRMNNAAGFLYLMHRSGLELDGYLPGTKKTYLQTAIDQGADKIVAVLLENQKNKDVNSLEKYDDMFSSVLSAEARVLSLEDSKLKKDKLYSLLLIAGNLLETGAVLSKQVMREVNAETPLANYLRKQYVSRLA